MEVSCNPSFRSAINVLSRLNTDVLEENIQYTVEVTTQPHQMGVPLRFLLSSPFKRTLVPFNCIKKTSGGARLAIFDADVQFSRIPLHLCI